LSVEFLLLIVSNVLGYSVDHVRAAEPSEK